MSSTGTAQIGVTGLAVMGSNIARNFARHGYTVALHCRSVARDRRPARPARLRGKVRPVRDRRRFLAALERPRQVLIMVRPATRPTPSSTGSLMRWARRHHHRRR